MTNYREILRLKALGMNKQETAASVGCSRNTVADVLRRAEAQKLSYPLPSDVTDSIVIDCEESMRKRTGVKDSN